MRRCPKKRTLANLSALSDEQLAAIRAILQGQQLRPVDALFEVVGSRAHGHVQAVRVAMSKLEIAPLLAARPSRERDLVAPAKRSAAAKRKAVSHELEDGTPAHSFATLIAELATIVRNTCLTPAAEPSATFDIDTRPNPKQQRALELLQTIQL